MSYWTLRRPLMKHVIINASYLLMIYAAAAEANNRPSSSHVQSISDIVGAGNGLDNNQQLLSSMHRSLILERKFYVNSHKTLSLVKSDYGIRNWPRQRYDRLYENVRWKRSSSNFSTNSNFIILNLSNKNLINAKRLADELSKYSLRQTSYEISHYYNLSDISALDLSRNNLTDELPGSVQSNFSVLSWLDLSENNLSTVERLNFPTLKYLNISCNRIKRFSSSSVQHLTRLDLSHNAIANSTQLSPLILRNLTDLDLRCNQLETLDKSFFLHTRLLHRLDLSGNAIKRLKRSIFYNLINLEQLNLAGNHINVIENDTFSYLVNLQFLDLSGNDIGPNSIRALQGIPALIGLSLADNVHLGSVMHEFVASWSLKDLDASGTGLCHIPTALAQSVKSLKLANNLLNVVRSGDLDSYPLLQQLILSDNLITDIEDDALGRLELLSTLFLDRNRLTRVPVSLPSNLIHLYLQSNEIYELQPSVFRNLKSLRTLNLAGNRIAYLPELPLPGLVTLNVQRNDLKRLSQSVVKTSPNLRDFLLENNPMKCADLLGIAEWAKPCRDELLFEDRDLFDGDDSGNEFDIFGRFTTGLKRDNSCKRKRHVHGSVVLTRMETKVALFKSQCRNENLINLNAPNRLKSDQTTVKHPLQDDKISSTISTPDTDGKISMINDKSGGIRQESLLNILIAWKPMFAGERNNSVTPQLLDNKREEKGNIKNTVAASVENFPLNVKTNLLEIAEQPLEAQKKSPNEGGSNVHTQEFTTVSHDILNNNSSVNKTVNLAAITPIVNVTGSERDEADNSSADSRSFKTKERDNRNSLIQADFMTTPEASFGSMQTASTSDKLAKITWKTTVESTSSSLVSVALPTSTMVPSMTSIAKKYDGKAKRDSTTPSVSEPTVMPLLTLLTMTTKTTNRIFVSNNSYRNPQREQDDTSQTNTKAESNLQRNSHPSGASFAKSQYGVGKIKSKFNSEQKPSIPQSNITKARKNVNHMKMKLKFNHHQMHDGEFRDDFDTDTVGLLRDSFGIDHENNAHRMRNKFSIYDSIYMASLKNAKIKPFHHAMHVPNASRAHTGTGSLNHSNEGIHATSVEASSKILPQEWNDARPMSNGGSHYGLFIVVGATLGMLISFGLFHLYYCRVRQGQHLHEHHHHQYQQYSAHQNHNSAHHRYSYAFEQDDGDERLTYSISTSVLDEPSELTSANSPIHHQQQQQHRKQDMLNMDVLNPLKSKLLSRNPSSSSSSSASSCFDIDNSGAEPEVLGVGGCGTSNQVPQLAWPSTTGQRRNYNSNTSSSHNNPPNQSHESCTDEVWIYYQNARGLRTKIDELFLASIDCGYDVIILTESGLNDCINSVQLFGSAFNVFRCDRSSRDSHKTSFGGVLIAVAAKYVSSAIETRNGATIEQVCVTTTIHGRKFSLCAVYLPPDKSREVAAFEQHVASIRDICDNAAPNEIILVCGDYNQPHLHWSINDGCNHLNRTLDLVFTSSDSVDINECAAPLLRVDPLHPPLVLSISFSADAAARNVDTSAEHSLNFRKIDFDVLLDYLSGLNWNAILNYSDVDDKAESFCSCICEWLSLNVPVSRRPNSPAWSTAELRRLKRQRLSKTKLMAIQIGLLRVQSNLRHNPKCFWNFVNSKRKNSAIPSLTFLDNEQSSSEWETCEQFVKFFASVFVSDVTLDQKIEQAIVDVPANIVDLDTFEVTQPSILAAINKMKSSFSPGPDGIPAVVYRRCATSLAYPLSLIFNSSFEQRKFPKIWKQSLMFPVFKKGDRRNVRNYRGITSLSAASKLFEIIVSQSIVSGVKCYISPDQHGFMPDRSVTTNLLNFTFTCFTQIESKGQVDVVYTDLKAAFDRIDHRILLHKLRHLGASDNLTEWLRSYLCHRTLRVKLGTCISTPFGNLSGVPQGSNLGPLLFTIFFNDVASLLDGDCKLVYADDFKLYSVCQRNKLIVSVPKCSVMTFHRIAQPIDYHIEDIKLNRVEEISDLGVLMDKKLTFANHRGAIIAKDNRQTENSERFQRSLQP
ncbi:uncharacterized protein LOC128745994 [Sabethes cyaneus]|uniref:uncharacterized protein LOC128745994 n=1 Tax=Sabethes cyaneus TaxID=53552 RepID=UPI00237D6C70|nr:uncharacterized protein LOC128745994 [Sabethes cyaneus]